MLRAQASNITKLAASAIPFIIAPTGTMGNNGAITLGTALPTTYANCYLNLPAGAIAASGPGSAAGWYFCQMSSATVGTVFNNVYTTGIPTIPASPAAFATTGPGAYTGVTTAVTGPTISVPGLAMGANGVLETLVSFSFPNNANNKTLNTLFGVTTILSFTRTTAVSEAQNVYIQNRGVSNSQITSNGPVPTANSGSQWSVFNVDTTTAQNLAFGGQLATATDFLVIERFLIEVMPG